MNGPYSHCELSIKTTYRAHVCKFSSTDVLNRKLQIRVCLLNIMLRPSRLPGEIDLSKSCNNAIQKTDVCVMKNDIVISHHEIYVEKKPRTLPRV